MNKDEVVEKVISYIESAEKDLQASKISNETKGSKVDIVNGILGLLDQEVIDEN